MELHDYPCFYEHGEAANITVTAVSAEVARGFAEAAGLHVTEIARVTGPPGEPREPYVLILRG